LFGSDVALVPELEDFVLQLVTQLFRELPFELLCTTFVFEFVPEEEKKRKEDQMRNKQNTDTGKKRT
jgi:hypothetical protein